MGAWAFERGTLWVMELTGGETVAASPRVAALFGEARRESAGPLAAVMGLPDPEPIRQRFATGRRCFVARIEDQIAAYGWVSQTAECIGELEREIQIRAGEAYIWDCVTLPPYRRRRLYSALLSHITLKLGGEGVRRVWIGSSLHNRPSIRGFANAGFQPVVTLLYLRLFNVCCLRLAGHSTAPGELTTAARRALATGHERAWGGILIGLSGPAALTACEG